ncbi:uncharacterized protein [Manis javanica]|uniref:uncharacterized protein n=1 Tax=Manis javanica TaxID=9974 RepID=UPI003C6D8E26
MEPATRARRRREETRSRCPRADTLPPVPVPPAPPTPAAQQKAIYMRGSDPRPDRAPPPPPAPRTQAKVGAPGGAPTAGSDAASGDAGDTAREALRSCAGPGPRPPSPLAPRPAHAQLLAPNSSRGPGPERFPAAAAPPARRPANSRAHRVGRAGSSAALCRGENKMQSELRSWLGGRGQGAESTGAELAGGERGSARQRLRAPGTPRVPETAGPRAPSTSSLRAAPARRHLTSGAPGIIYARIRPGWRRPSERPRERGRRGAAGPRAAEGGPGATSRPRAGAGAAVGSPRCRCAAAAQLFWQLLRAHGRRAAAPGARAVDGATSPRPAPSRSQGAPPQGRKQRLQAGSDSPRPQRGASNARQSAAARRRKNPVGYVNLPSMIHSTHNGTTCYNFLLGALRIGKIMTSSEKKATKMGSLKLEELACCERQRWDANPGLLNP